MRNILRAALVCLFALAPVHADNFLVLPFFNVSGDANLEWIGESLSETVREALASEGVIALSRDDRQEGFRRLSLRTNSQLTRASILRIGEILDADQVIYGEYTFNAPPDGGPKIKGTIKITAQIVNLRKAARGPQYEEMGSLEDLARLQITLSWKIIRLISPNAAASEDEFRSKRPVLRVEAIENHTRGLIAPTPDQKMKLFAQAVRIDPRHSPATFELGRLYWQKQNWKLAADHFRRVAMWDIRYREALFYLGLSRYQLDDFAGAEEAFRTVAAAVPLNEVLNNLAAAQSRRNSREALANFSKALEGDPGDPDYHFNVGYALYKSGDLERAAERFRAVLDRHPEDTEAITMLGRCLKKPVPGRLAAAAPIEGLERLKDTYEESAWLQLKAVLEPKR